MRARGTNRGEGEGGRREGDWWEREYLSESLTDYLFTYTLACVCASVIVCVVCFPGCGCGSEHMLTVGCCSQFAQTLHSYRALSRNCILCHLSKHLVTGSTLSTFNQLSYRLLNVAYVIATGGRMVSDKCVL